MVLHFLINIDVGDVFVLDGIKSAQNKCWKEESRYRQLKCAWKLHFKLYNHIYQAHWIPTHCATSTDYAIDQHTNEAKRAWWCMYTFVNSIKRTASGM